MKDGYKTHQSFVGAISPFLLFELEYHSLDYLVEQNKNDKFYHEINPASQVACIGLVASFEAFCKHQFAALVNLFPALINSFCVKRGEPTIEFSTIVAFGDCFEKNIGFALAEVYDFGTAKAINGIFRDLLLVTPFNKAEVDKFNSILNQRNLLVHHGGYYTVQYLKKNASKNDIAERAFKDAVKIDTNDYQDISDFLFNLAMKITRGTVRAVRKHYQMESTVLTAEQSDGLNELLQGVHDSLDDSI